MKHLPVHPLLVHPRTGAPLRAVGFSRRGPIWPIIGGDGSEDDANDKGDDADAGAEDKDDQGDDADNEGADQLADKGKQALDRMKTQRNTARDQLREFKALGLSPEQIKALQKGDAKSDDQPDVDQIREQTRAEVRAEAAKERVVDKIEAKAARAFADAEDAVAILMRTHDAEDFLDDGKVDVEAIQEALDELLEKKPHLAVQDGKRFKGTPDGGARKAARPGQLTRDDLSRMSPQDIVKAKAEGRLNDVLGTK